MNRILFIALLILSVSSLRGQTINSFMDDVIQNHPDINSARKLLLAGEADSKTGLSPEDPEVSLGYFPGNEPSPGDKITWGISQSFDFPTRYARIKDLKNTNLELAKMEYSLTYVEIMSEARSAAIKYINLIDTRRMLESRTETMNRLAAAYAKLLERGETSLIEYNKILLKQVQLNSDLASLDISIDILKARLDIMSGNGSDKLIDSSYPEFETMDFLSLREQLRLSHPAFLVHSLRTEQAEKTIKLSMSENMPSFEMAYSSEIVADQRFTGPSLGISIPLWKNRGRVNKSRADSDFAAVKAEGDILMLESLFSAYYRSYNANMENIDLISDALEKANNKELLDMALGSGEMDLTEYLLELGSIYELQDILLKLKKDKYLLLSKLNELDFCPD